MIEVIITTIINLIINTRSGYNKFLEFSVISVFVVYKEILSYRCVAIDI